MQVVAIGMCVHKSQKPEIMKSWLRVKVFSAETLCCLTVPSTLYYSILLILFN